ncbi:hypothetical protein [Janibacter sp. G1551]|uniref:hypothetical protein n=1 Tax=Janibacter sp. G1551 TaxID=3420440 RepID=UPI003D052E71
MSDELQAALDALDAPRDAVPRRPLTRADVERVAAMAGQEVTVREPGRPIYDSDGALIGMTEATETKATSGGLSITRAEADRLGIADGEITGLHIIDPQPPVFFLPR